MRALAHHADIVIRIPADPKQRELQHLDDTLRLVGAWVLEIHAKASALAVGMAAVAFGFGCITSLVCGVRP